MVPYKSTFFARVLMNIDSFVPNAPFLYPMKTSWRGRKRVQCIGNEWFNPFDRVNPFQSNVPFLSKHRKAWQFQFLGGMHEWSIALKWIEIINHDFWNVALNTSLTSGNFSRNNATCIQKIIFCSYLWYSRRTNLKKKKIIKRKYQWKIRDGILFLTENKGINIEVKTWIQLYSNSNFRLEFKAEFKPKFKIQIQFNILLD